MNYHLKSMLRQLARPVARLTAAAVIFLSPGAFSVMSASAADQNEEGAEVLTRGPVHEAFAATISFKPASGVLVPKAPPAPIEELAPDQRPEGDNVTWIPGYWAWDDETTEFLWVSGIWRNLPPGRQWMPGYWSESGQEWQWISGYWADAAVEEVEYLGPPPASIEAGPNIERPSRNHSWIPGNWAWGESRYRWRPGYWDLPQPNWVWVPSYYTWTPRGYIYVDGYYDYDVGRRGMIFAPVRFTGGYYSRPDYYYQPTVVISLFGLLDHLFLHPHHHHYYFGDYYAPEYRRSGYYASYSYYSGGYGYDPIYAHERWRHRDDNRWERRREENFRFYRDNRDERPPHTLTAFNTFMAKPDTNRRVEAGFATRLDQIAASKEAPVKLTAVNEAERKTFTQRGKEIREFGNQRKKLGVRSAVAADTVKPGTAEPGKGEPVKTEPVREKISRSPIVAKAPAAAAPENTPPKRREVTTADVEPGEKVNPRRRPGTKGDRETTPGEKPKLDPKDPSTDVPKADPENPRKRDPKMQPKVDPNDPSKDVPKADPENPRKRDPKVEPKDVPKREPKIEPGEIPKREPKIEPGEIPKREPKIEPKETPKREPKMVPKEEPKREPKVESKREVSKIAPQPEPRRQPKAEPQQKPNPQPKAAPREQPKPSREPATPKKTDSTDEKEKEKRRKG